MFVEQVDSRFLVLDKGQKRSVQSTNEILLTKINKSFEFSTQISS